MQETKDFINTLSKEIYQANKAKGFWEDRTELPQLGSLTGEESIVLEKAFNAQMLALIHSEISEALEADRKDLMDDKLPHRKGLEVELADTMIRIFDMAGGLGIDLGGALTDKLEYNTSRAYKHGKQY